MKKFVTLKDVEVCFLDGYRKAETKASYSFPLEDVDSFGESKDGCLEVVRSIKNILLRTKSIGAEEFIKCYEINRVIPIHNDRRSENTMTDFLNYIADHIDLKFNSFELSSDRSSWMIKNDSDTTWKLKSSEVYEFISRK